MSAQAHGEMATPAPGDPVSEQVELIAADGAGSALEEAVAQAVPLFLGSKGCRSLRLQESVETPGHYRMTIVWETLDDHLVGFRTSDAFGRWRELVTPHLAEPPRVEHFTTCLDAD